MRKKILVCALALGAMMVFSGCGANAEPDGGSGSNSTDEAATNEEISQEVSEANIALYEAGYEEVKNYFDIEPDSTLFSDECVIDMGEYAIVMYIEGDGSVFASISYDDKSVFSINALHYELNEFAKANQDKIKDLKNPIEVDEYMYSLEPGAESEAKENVEKFISETELSGMGMELKEMLFEYVFDKQDKEYFVFEYTHKNDDGTEKSVFVRYHNLMKRVVSVIK
jgi:hypothetical protein